MSACARERTERLEAWLRGELGPEQEHALGHHLARCQACAVELAWLESERALFSQRAARQQAPAEAWAHVGDALAASPRRRPEGRAWRRVGLAVAAGVLLFTVGRVQPSGRVPEAVSAAPVLSELEEGERLSQDPASLAEERYGACLVATPAGRRRCEPMASVPASFP